MGSRYERYIFHMCTMKIVAKLIYYEQIQTCKKTNIQNNILKYENKRFFLCL